MQCSYCGEGVGDYEHGLCRRCYTHVSVRKLKKKVYIPDWEIISDRGVGEFIQEVVRQAITTSENPGLVMKSRTGKKALVFDNIRFAKDDIRFIPAVSEMFDIDEGRIRKAILREANKTLGVL